MHNLNSNNIRAIQKHQVTRWAHIADGLKIILFILFNHMTISPGRKDMFQQLIFYLSHFLRTISCIQSDSDRNNYKFSDLGVEPDGEQIKLLLWCAGRQRVQCYFKRSKCERNKHNNHRSSFWEQLQLYRHYSDSRWRSVSSWDSVLHHTYVQCILSEILPILEIHNIRLKLNGQKQPKWAITKS